MQVLIAASCAELELLIPALTELLADSNWQKSEMLLLDIKPRQAAKITWVPKKGAEEPKNGRPSSPYGYKKTIRKAS